MIINRSRDSFRRKAFIGKYFQKVCPGTLRIRSDSEISFCSEIPKTVLNSEPVYRIYWDTNNSDSRFERRL
ncbi:hypothetical protein LEP1GSC188_2718 [Leptospira weilii serovar Topaz str. LT2116]|uniref:Uncharacterized protein n=1 Tax=Leptospira weilii serovar Topaz str. LT2116 TaxID=1088540 RepID=M3G5G1_9LEPT|nr:hypothetical protein LEP1GSC188_2718 [Leptospira weilii serovar Topaz str. LT2116]